LCEGLQAAGLKQERRALRVRVGTLQWRWLGDDALELDFQLPPGAYATELLAELGDLSGG
jgi:tRNA pseudouridine13 synthase